MAEKNQVIVWLKHLARLMGVKEPEPGRASDYATLLAESFDASLFDSRAMRAVAAKFSYFPYPHDLIGELTQIQRERQAKPALGGRTLREIHRTYGEAWNDITNEVLKDLAETIAAAAGKLEEGDRGHFRFLVTDEVRSLCSPLAQAVAMGRERPPFPHARLDLVALARRTESQLHSTAGYEGRKNISWWERRYGPQVAAVESVPERPPAPEMVWSNPNAGRWDNPNK